MKKVILSVIIVGIHLHLYAQHSGNVTVAFSNNNTALPFSKFTTLATGTFHPGIEIGSGFNWRTKAQHDWFQNIKLGYLYHHLVQHGITLYTQAGYRFKAGKSLYAEMALGVGYMYAVPATQVFKLNESGTYDNITGMGRHQAMAAHDVSLGYVLNPQARRPVKIFITYQQRIQAPFVRSLMSVLPYNTLLMGGSLIL